MLRGTTRYLMRGRPSRPFCAGWLEAIVWKASVRLGITEYIDCAHFLPGHTKCGQVHGHTYRVDVTIEGEASGGMVVDFADLKARTREVLQRYDHRHWNDVLEFPSVENICSLLSRELREKIPFPMVIRVWEGNGKWAEI
jgi:6-pyruvoyltetrahydropterin/6-carboxytetrahydropterin synthase